MGLRSYLYYQAVLNPIMGESKVQLRTLAFLIASCFSFVVSIDVVYADTKKPETPRLALKALINEVNDANPEIKAAGESFEASKSRAPQAESLPDPSLGFMSNNMSNPVPLTTLGKDSQSNAGVSFSQEIPFPGKLSLKGDIAKKESDKEFQMFEGVRLGVLARAKRAFFDLYYAYEAAEVLGENKSSLEKLARVAQARYESGEGTQADVLKAELEVSIVDGQLRALEQQRLSSSAQLNSIMNRTAEMAVPRPEKVSPSILGYSAQELISIARERSPMLLAQQKSVQQSLLSRNLAKKDYYPDMTVGGYYGNNGDLPEMWQFRVDFKVPLYFWTKQKEGVKEAQHKVHQAERSEEAAGQVLNFSIKDKFAQAKASEDLVRLYSGRIQSQAKATLESSLISYQVGKLDFLTVISNVVGLRDYKLRYEEELVKYEKALVDLEELCALTIVA